MEHLQGAEQSSEDAYNACRFPSLTDCAAPPPQNHGDWSLSQLDSDGDCATATFSAALALLLYLYIGEESIGFLSGSRSSAEAGDGFARSVTVQVNKDTAFSTLVKNSTVDSAAARVGPLRLSGLGTETDPGSNLPFNTLLLVGDDSNQLDRQALSTFHPDIHLVLAVDCRERAYSLVLWYRGAILSEGYAARILSTYHHILAEILRDPARSLADIDYLSDDDLASLAEQNSGPPDVVHECVHHLFERQARSTPTATAVCSWDGELTYAELDDLSTRLASQLEHQGVGAEDVVLLCFEKSRWAVVSQLAVLKSGGACAFVSPDHPPAHVQRIASQTRARVALVTPDTAHALSDLPLTVNLVSDLSSIPPRPSIPTPRDPTRAPHPDSPAYIQFTSGSTGVPKGIVVEHAALSTSLRAHGTAMGYTAASRVLQFAAYTFDVCVSDTFGPLLVGGCVCVPSEADRTTRPAAAVRALRADTLCLTSTVASLLDPADVAPCVRRLALGGEPATREVIARWTGVEGLRLGNVYGPAEASVWCAFNDGVTADSDPRDVGRAVGCQMLIVHPDDPTKLMPLGALGEIVISGPILARGYLGSEMETARVFVPRPRWAIGGGDVPALGRVYRTGDLGRRTLDGRILCCGRKDLQAKLNGQRVEVEDVQHHLGHCLRENVGIVVDVVRTNDRPILVAFVALDDRDAMGSEGGVLLPATRNVCRRLQPIAAALRAGVAQRLPAYMAPSLYLPISHVPLSVSGKLDRKRLKSAAARLSRVELNRYGVIDATEIKDLSNQQEEFLEFITGALRIPPEATMLSHTFLSLGGDSVSAIRLIGLLRAAGMELSVQDIFRATNLGELAEFAGNRPASQVTVTTSVPPFALISQRASINDLRETVAANLGLPYHSIDDIYPCVPMQIGLFALAQQVEGAYVAQERFILSERADLDRFRASWDQVVAATDILRTRIVYDNELGYLQVVVRGDIDWRQFTDATEYMHADRRQGFWPGEPLVRFALSSEAGDAQAQVVWTIHHALYDAFSMDRILIAVAEAYRGVTIPRPPLYNGYVTFVLEQEARSAQFWQEHLEQFDTRPWPPISETPASAGVTDTLIMSMTLPSRRTQCTIPTLLKAAWTLVCSDYSGSPQVCYGMTVMGRNVPVEGIESMPGPTLSTVPFFVSINPEMNLETFLREIQQRSLDIMPFEHFGLQNISRVSPQAKNACNFQNLLVIQTPPEPNDPTQIPGVTREADSSDEFTNYPVSIVCEPSADGVRIQANFLPESVDKFQMQKILEHYTHLVEQLSQASENLELRNIDKLSPAHKEQIRIWNASVPASAQACIHHNFDLLAASQPEAPAVDAWDGQWTYAELARRAAVLATKLLETGVGREALLPICFEKSKWVIVAMLATLKVGATIVPLDPQHPGSRLRDIVEETQSSLMLCSMQTYPLCERLVQRALIVSDENTEGYDSSIHTNFPAVSPDMPFACLFTSGSTGRPKGALLEHRNMTSVVAHCARRMGWTPTSRVAQFSSYAFDVCMWEIWGTLTSGACICIPSDAARTDDLVGVLNDFRIEIFGAPASVIRTLRPEQVPYLKSLRSGGEYVTQDLVRLWSAALHFTIVYGPCECCVISTLNHVDDSEFKDHVGFGAPCIVWIADPDDHNKLAPVGCVGECIVQGPNVGRGYLHNDQQTRASFIEEPPWAIKTHPKELRRFYKTGDLVRYHPTGAMRFVGRKDSQVKVRGQRMELGEIEHKLDADPLVRNVLVLWPRLGQFRGKVVAVLNIHAQPAAPILLSTSIVPVDLTGSEYRDAIRSIQAELSTKVPSYMVPSSWFLVEQIPQLVSRKLNRRAVQSWVEGEDIPVEHAMGLHDDKAPNGEAEDDRPMTEVEQKIRDVWASVLSISSAKLRSTTSFIGAGGDSISAMRVVALCRSEGLRARVVDVLQSKSIIELASRSQSGPGDVTKEPDRISGKGEASVQHHLMGIDLGSFPNGSDPRLSIGDIEDAYPCTPLQDSMLNSNARDASLFTPYFIWRTNLAKGSSDTANFIESWKSVFSRHTALRTVFLPKGSSWIQLVIHCEKFSTEKHIITIDPGVVNTLRELESLERPRYEPGQPLQRLTVCPVGETVYLRFDMVHALLDGISFDIIRAELGQAFAGVYPRGQEALMKSIMQHSLQRQGESTAYWKNYLDGLQACMLPVSTGLEISATQPKGPVHQVMSVDVAAGPRAFCQSRGVLFSSLIQTAWALCLSVLTGTDRVCFGYLVSGRHLDIAGIETGVAPCLSLLTQKVYFQRGKPLSIALDTVSRDNAESLNHVHTPDEGRRGLFNAVINHRKSMGHAKAQEASSRLQMEWIASDDPWDYDLMIEVDEPLAGNAIVSFQYRHPRITASLGPAHAAVFRGAYDLLLKNLDYTFERALASLS